MENILENKELDNKKNIIFEIVLNVIGVILYIITLLFNFSGTLKISIIIMSYLILSYDIIINSIKSIFKKHILDENCLMFVATVGALCIKQYSEAIAVIVFFKIGEILEDYFVNKYRKNVKEIVDISPKHVNLKVDNEVKTVSPEQVKIDDLFIIKAGEKIPIDGIIVNGESTINMSALTGESIPKEVKQGDEVLSGSINVDGLLVIKATKTFKDSTFSKIIDLIENATSKKSKTEKFITRFSKIYTPVVIIIAVIIAFVPCVFFNQEFLIYLNRALIFLVISCPCALVISIPLGFLGGIARATKEGIIIKGSNYLDSLNNVDTIVFDKTGTLTKGNFEITDIVTKSDLSKDDILKYIALVETVSNHYIAKSIVNCYLKKDELDQKVITKYSEIAGLGIKAVVNDNEILVGNYKLLDDNNIKYEKEDILGTDIHLAINNEYKGYIVISDQIKSNAADAIKSLRENGISNICMVTGDSKNIACDVSNKLGLDKVYYELLPDQKVQAVENLKNDASKIAYVGDGINDAAVIASSDIGIAMGSGSDIAIESADIILMTSNLEKLNDLIKISKKTKKVVSENIIFALFVKISILILGGLGFANMWEAVFADVGVTIITILNTSKVIRYKIKK